MWPLFFSMKFVSLIRRIPAVREIATLGLGMFLLVGCQPQLKQADQPEPAQAQTVEVAGQVFVVVPSGENMRLGSVQVLLFEEEAVEEHLRQKEQAMELERQTLQARVAELQEKEASHQVALAEADAAYRSREAAIREAVVEAKKVVAERAGKLNQQISANNDFIEHVDVMPPPPVGVPNPDAFKEYEKRRDKWLSMGRTDRQVWAKAMASLNEEMEAGIALLEANREKQINVWVEELGDLDQKIETERLAVTRYQAALVSLNQELARLPADDFFLADLPAPLWDLRTDADGEFGATLPAGKRYAIMARADRKLGGEPVSFRWFVWMQSGGQGGQKIILSNHNLIGTPSDENVVQRSETSSEAQVNNS